MRRYSDALARRVKQGLEERGVSSREAAKASSGAISHMTINEMMNGVVPGPELVAAFALAIGDDPDPYLEAAAYPFRYRMDQEGGRTNDSTSPEGARKPGTDGSGQESGAFLYQTGVRPLALSANENLSRRPTSNRLSGAAS